MENSKLNRINELARLAKERELSQEELDQLQVGVVIRSDPEPGTQYTQKETNYIVLYYY